MTENPIDEVLDTSLELNSTGNALAVELIKPKDFLIQFLKDTKEWDKIEITKEYILKAKKAEEIVRLVNNLRVSISRVRSNYKANGKKVPPFRFTSQIDLTGEDSLGYKIFKVTLGKSNSACSQNKTLLEELL